MEKWKTHRHCAGRALRVMQLAVDDDFVIERLRRDIGVATATTAAQIER